jgi:pyrophosphate--fructose-6-phosphate 1-phosphotransferase
MLEDVQHVHFAKHPSETVVSEQLKPLFPKTHNLPILKGHKGAERVSRPLRVGVVFSGGPASGGHNVVAGLYDALKMLHPTSRLFGFLGGPAGIISNTHLEITENVLDPYRNQGGFDLLGSGRIKIETAEQLHSSLVTMQNLQLDGLVVIGGDDSNTNAAILAEYFLSKDCATKVIGVPKTIDGDLRHAYLEISFGFDTACKIYAELIGNISRDAISARKYYHFIKLMGRSASHITLECALSTHPNMALIGEEIASKKTTLEALTQEICDLICKRSSQGKEYGVILIPEGLIEFVPEVGTLIKELTPLAGLKIEEVRPKLSSASLQCFNALPEEIQKQLLFDRDAHGNVNVSAIATESLLINTVSKELKLRKQRGVYKGTFNPLAHFFGYEGRAGFPSSFDCHFCTALGMNAALLIDEGVTGYMSCVQNLTRPVKEWQIVGMPLTALMHLEMRKGQLKPVIQKALVDLNGKAFHTFSQARNSWAVENAYRFPGPMQFFGPSELTDTFPMTLSL